MLHRVVVVITCDEGKDGVAQVGRTGRAGRPGRVTSLYTHQQAPLAEAIRCPPALRCTISVAHHPPCTPSPSSLPPLHRPTAAIALLQPPAEQARTDCFLVSSSTPVRGPDVYLVAALSLQQGGVLACVPFGELACGGMQEHHRSWGAHRWNFQSKPQLRQKDEEIWEVRSQRRSGGKRIGIWVQCLLAILSRWLLVRPCTLLLARHLLIL